jgi:RNA polymerase sigma factor (sigma-70 family)
MDQVQLKTTDLKVGLYVANLDRPWLETPFLFQGFCIRDDDEIAELQKYCKSVFVDVEQSNISEPERAALRAAAHNGKPKSEAKESETARRRRLAHIPEPDLSRTGQYYVDTEKLGKELERAQGVQKNATVAVTHMMDSIRNGETLDVPQLEQVVDPLVDSVLRNRDEAVAEAALAALEPEDRTIVELRYREGLSVADVARALGLAQKPLYRRLDRLLAHLRASVSRCSAEWGDVLE